MSQKIISAVISAYNEEKKIAACLDSLKWVDEIIFVDNSSTDKTAEIAKKYNAKILTQKNDPSNIDLQKNLGIEKATGEWILVLDSDEEVTPELAKEIQSICHSEAEPKNLRENGQIDGYLIPRKNIIFGKWIEHTGWYPDYQLRLFRNGKGKYQKKHFHEPIMIVGKTEKLNQHILHHNYETVSQFLYKHFQIYAPNEADELIRKGYSFDWKGIIRLPMSEFLNRYFASGGYKDGFHGLVLSILMAAYHLAIFVYLWEKKNFVDVNENIISGLEEELKKSKKDISYWIGTKKILDEKNPLKKGVLKIKRKINI